MPLAIIDMSLNRESIIAMLQTQMDTVSHIIGAEVVQKFLVLKSSLELADSNESIIGALVTFNNTLGWVKSKLSFEGEDARYDLHLAITQQLYAYAEREVALPVLDMTKEDHEDSLALIEHHLFQKYELHPKWLIEKHLHDLSNITLIKGEQGNLISVSERLIEPRGTEGAKDFDPSLPPPPHPILGGSFGMSETEDFELVPPPPPHPRLSKSFGVSEAEDFELVPPPPPHPILRGSLGLDEPEYFDDDAEATEDSDPSLPPPQPPSFARSSGMGQVKYRYNIHFDEIATKKGGELCASGVGKDGTISTMTQIALDGLAVVKFLGPISPPEVGRDQSAYMHGPGFIIVDAKKNPSSDPTALLAAYQSTYCRGQLYEIPASNLIFLVENEASKKALVANVTKAHSLGLISEDRMETIKENVKTYETYCMELRKINSDEQDTAPTIGL